MITDCTMSKEVPSRINVRQFCSQYVHLVWNTFGYVVTPSDCRTGLDVEQVQSSRVPISSELVHRKKFTFHYVHSVRRYGLSQFGNIFKNVQRTKLVFRGYIYKNDFKLSLQRTTCTWSYSLWQTDYSFLHEENNNLTCMPSYIILQFHS